MRTLHISHSDYFGGAARAAYRLHDALRKTGQSSKMLVQKKQSSDVYVTGPKNYLDKAGYLFRIFIGEFVIRLQHTDTSLLHTSSWYPFSDGSLLEQANKADIVNLHWFREIPSIKTIANIKKPVVWTLHDMWAFCGAEHIAAYNSNARWRTGYLSGNKSTSNPRLDINRWVWSRKKRHWKRPLHIITPSNWLAKCVSNSALMHSWPTHVIPNVLNTSVFKPLDRSYARHVLGLPQDQRIILFGAIMGGDDPNKGFDLLQKALVNLSATKKDEYTCVVFGQGKPVVPPRVGLPIQWMGHLSDEWTLALLYNAADVMVVPSLQENLPQTGTEAQACGCPVVAFNTTGLPDVVAHKKTGYLARPFESDDLGHGISWVLENEERYQNLSAMARERAVCLWAPDVIVPQYLNVYRQAIEEQRMLRGE